MVGDAPIFGMHYSLAKPGSVSVGDKVLVAPAAVAGVVVVVAAGVVVLYYSKLLPWYYL